ncbi:MAG: hypothetical protein ACK56I_21955, partial [bacterium]
DLGACPFAIELPRHNFVVLLVVAAVAEEHDGAESRELQAARRGLEHLAVHVHGVVRTLEHGLVDLRRAKQIRLRLVGPLEQRRLLQVRLREVFVLLAELIQPLERAHGVH